MKVFIPSSLLLAGLATTQTQAAFPDSAQRMIDESVDPCDDFFQYSCGKWIEEFPLAEDRQHYSFSFNGVADEGAVAIDEIIKEDWPLVGELWDSCINVNASSAAGARPLQKGLGRISALSRKEDVFKLGGEFSAVGPNFFAGFGVRADAKDATTNAVYTGVGSITLPDKSYYLDEEVFNGLETEYRTYINTVLKLAGVGTDGGQQGGQQQGKPDPDYAANVIIDLEKKLATILPTDEETDGAESVYNPIKYSDAVKTYPLTIGAVADGLQLLENSALSKESILIFDTPAYYERAEKLISTISVSDLKLYLSFQYINYYATYLGEDFLQAQFEFFSKKLTGATAIEDRVRTCTDVQVAMFPDLFGKYYFLKKFDSAREDDVREILSNLQDTMGDRLTSVDWLDDATREAAAVKLGKITNLIGHSTQKKDYPFILERDNYMGNAIAISANNWHNQLAKIGQPVDRTEWGMSAAKVNAYYEPSQNQIVFPAAILQPPFYQGSDVHPVQNYGAIGMVIGHELSHGFDTTGRSYDGDGNLRDWWSEQTAVEFEERAQCLKDQYSTFPAYGDSGNPVGYVNGNFTIGENIADNGGAGLGYDAYLKWAATAGDFDKKGVEDDEVDKLFFVSFSQIWCNKIRDGKAAQLLKTDVHAPKRWRVNGVVMNNDKFAETFQCPVGSKMNPEKKCKLW